MDECVYGQMDGQVHAMYGQMYGLTNVDTCAYPFMGTSQVFRSTYGHTEPAGSQTGAHSAPVRCEEAASEASASTRKFPQNTKEQIGEGLRVHPTCRHGR